jgi:hypothetical protein
MTPSKNKEKKGGKGKNYGIKNLWIANTRTNILFPFVKNKSFDVKKIIYYGSFSQLP